MFGFERSLELHVWVLGFRVWFSSLPIDPKVVPFWDSLIEF